jgi:homoserine O-acetyltransferase
MAHPALQEGWIDRPHLCMPLGDLPLESGELMLDAQVSYVVHGELAAGRPVVLALSAIGSTHHRLDFLIGPGRALDPARVTVIAVDALGNGLSSSPSNSVRQAGEQFPRFCIRDMVRSQQALLDRLGVTRLHAVVGASMGGMQALQWAVSEPTRMDHVVAMTPMARTSAWAQIFNTTSRKVLQAHPGWSRGDPACWEAWVPLMQMLCSRTPQQWDQALGSAEAVQDEIQSRTLLWQAQGFSPLDWIYQSWAYDAHDVGSTPGLPCASALADLDANTSAALACVKAKTLILAPPLDLYNPVACAQWAASQITGAQFLEIPSIWGHQSASAGDPGAGEFLNQSIGLFLA